MQTHSSNDVITVPVLLPPSGARKFSIGVRSQKDLQLKTPRTIASSKYARPDLKFVREEVNAFGKLSSLTQKLNGRVAELAVHMDRAVTPDADEHDASDDTFLTELLRAANSSSAHEVATQNEAVIHELLETFARERDKGGLFSNTMMLPPLTNPKSKQPHKAAKKKVTLFPGIVSELDSTIDSSEPHTTYAKTNSMSSVNWANQSSATLTTPSSSSAALKTAEGEKTGAGNSNIVRSPTTLNYFIIERNIEIAKGWAETHGKVGREAFFKKKKAHEKRVYEQAHKNEQEWNEYCIAKRERKDAISESVVMQLKHATHFKRVKQLQTVFCVLSFWLKTQVAYKNRLKLLHYTKMRDRAANLIQFRLSQMWRGFIHRKVNKAFPRGSKARKLVEDWVRRWHADYLETASRRLRSFLLNCVHYIRIKMHTHMFLAKVRKVQRFARKAQMRRDAKLLLLRQAWRKTEITLIQEWEEKVTADAMTVIQHRKQARLKDVKEQERSQRMHGKPGKSAFADKPPEVGGIKVPNKAIQASINDQDSAGKWFELLDLAMKNEGVTLPQIREHMIALGICPPLQPTNDRLVQDKCLEIAKARSAEVRKATEAWALKVEEERKRQMVDEDDAAAKKAMASLANGGLMARPKTKVKRNEQREDHVKLLPPKEEMADLVRIGLRKENARVYPLDVAVCI
eukprot:TRINITY_DN37503_c0_g1_i1.p1 TRINITY_DN37503_c0_g1~~TRINITY_DN37503_c0_g1_i1.p1  ORF type:complete len:686 (+),score=57.62 TRINITY_DN37503_c0_g1_i1:92-2149(+)